MLSEKINNWLNKDYRETFYERVEYMMESEPLFKDFSHPIRYGKTMKYIMDRISVPVYEDEKIIGSVKEIIPTQEQIDYVEQLSHTWWHNKDLEEVQKELLWSYSHYWVRRRAPWFYSFGHLGFDWETIVNKGLGYIKSHAEECLKQHQGDSVKEDYLKGALICIESYIDYIARYAAELIKTAESAQDPARKAELEKSYDSFMHIKDKAPRTFYEALQLIWIIVLPTMKVAGCGVFNLSRMDQYLYPFYEKDLKDGILTDEEAVALIEEFYFKNNEIMAPVDHMSLDDDKTTFTMEVTFDDPNYLILGGYLKGKKPGVNKLTSLFVKAAHNTRLKNPFIILRYYDGIDEKFWLEAIDAIRDNTTIVIYNDETMIPALQYYGIDEEDVWDYGFYGCNDPSIPGKEGGLRQLWFNLARPLELALNKGDYPMEPKGENLTYDNNFALLDRMVGLMTGPYYGKKTKDVSECKTMDDFLEIYREQVEFLINQYREKIEVDIANEEVWNKGKLRIEDCFLQGTLENAETWNNGGTKYHKIISQATGLATVADSLAAIDLLVFKNKEMTLAELVEILNNNFEGNETLMNRLKKSFPKYGNDNEDVDKYARIAAEIFCEANKKANGEKYLYKLFPTLSSDRDFTTMGSYVGATPDGRKQKDRLSENQSPTEGCDVKGLTALLNSVCNIDFKKVTGGPLNVRVHPSAVKGEKGLAMFASALRTYFSRGGLQTQINIVSTEQLKEAQINPDKYKNLCVRVTGYSAFFTQMGKKAQDEMIKRSEKA